MVLNLQRIMENDNMILLQNEDLFLFTMTWLFFMFLSSGYLKGTLPKGNFPCYKMKLGIYMLSSDG